MSKTAENMKIVVDLFMSHGFVPDGKTMEETVRVPTVDAPVRGASGGELRTFGGRDRLASARHQCSVHRGPTYNKCVRSRGRSSSISRTLSHVRSCLCAHYTFDDASTKE